MNMDLREYMNTYPRNQRKAARLRMAKAHAVAEVTVRSWANGSRKHPFTRRALEITERLTEGKVTRYDLRPDIFGRPPGK